MRIMETLNKPWDQATKSEWAVGGSLAVAAVTAAVMGYNHIINNIDLSTDPIQQTQTEALPQVVSSDSGLTVHEVVCVKLGSETKVYAGGKEIPVFAAAHSDKSPLCPVVFSENFSDAITGEVHIHDAQVVPINEALQRQGQQLRVVEPL